MIDRLETLPIVLSEQSPDAIDQVLLDDAQSRAAEFDAKRGEDRIAGLVTSQGHIAHKFLEAASVYLTTDQPSFCEWGSGLGIVTCLAGRRNWHAVGVEIEPRLVDAARDLSVSHGIDVAFYQGSYKPPGFFDDTSRLVDFETDHGFGLFDFDVIYAYPWPAEQEALTRVIARHARAGTIFLRYGGGLQCDAFRAK